MAGWFRGDVMGSEYFLGSPLEAEGSTSDVIVASVAHPESSPSQQKQIYWATKFTGAGNNEALAIASGPICSTGSMQVAQASQECCVAQEDLIAVGGYYSEEMAVKDPFNQANSKTLSTGAVPAGFVVLLTRDGSVRGAMSLAGAGPVRVDSVAIDKCHNVYVAGRFSSASTDFAPQGGIDPTPISYSGGTDIFVAKYGMVVVGTPQGTVLELQLQWLYTTGSPGDDAAMAVAVASDGAVYAAGYMEDAATSFAGMPEPIPYCPLPGPNRDIWFAAFDATGALDWEHTIFGWYDEAATGLALDAFDNPTITGFFGVERCVNPTTQYMLDIAPHAQQTYILTNYGGYDGFVARYNRADGSLHEAFRLGGEWNEKVQAVAFSPVAPWNMYHGGFFGGRFAPGPGPNEYEVNFDPAGGTAPEATAITRGGADAFINVMSPETPQVVMQVSLLLDTSNSISSSEWEIVREAYSTLLANTALVPQNGTVAMNVVLYGAGPGAAREVIPWTRLTSETGPLFAARFGTLERLGGENYLTEGITVAAESIVGSGIVACYRIIHAMVEGLDDETSVAAARDAAILAGIDQVNAIGLHDPNSPIPFTRTFLVQNVVAQSIGHPTSPPFAFAGWVWDAWRDDPPNVAELHDVLGRTLWRVSRCPGDFNEDGLVNAQDIADFQAAHSSEDPLADWDMDDNWDSFDEDFFYFSWSTSCPCY